MNNKINLENISVILNQPRYPENIGSSARAILNMGIDKLVVVNPVNFDLERVMKLATHVASDIIRNIKIYSSLREALAPFNFVVGTTARLGGERQTVTLPSKMAEKLVSISQKNRIAILFGAEDRGLTNEDIRYCHELVNIPTAEFSSLNLAQAVMVICYHLFTAGNEKASDSSPRLANRHELDGMYDQLKDILVKISFINHENPDYWMNNIRRFFTRLQLRAKEVSIIRGICRQIEWYGRKNYKDGQNNPQNSQD